MQGFNIAHETTETVFDELAKDLNRQARYAAAMNLFNSGPDLESTHVVHGFPWTYLHGGTVVDVGGSHGSVSIAIARSLSGVKCVVQDKLEIIRDGESKLPSELRERVTFMEHDFFNTQPIKSADVYILRWILHDWPDPYAVKILRALIPALTKTSRLCICEYVLPQWGAVSTYQERSIRSMDLAMMEFHNSKERGAADWAALLERADPRFQIVNIKTPSGSRLSMIEVLWRSDK